MMFNEELEVNKKVIRNIGIFAIIVIISGWLGVLVDTFLTGQPQGNTLGMGVWLVLPLLTAFIIIFYSGLSWRELGIRLNFKNNIKWYLASVLIFPIVTALVLIIGAAMNWIDFSAFNCKSFILGFIGTLFANFAIDIFEETAWRGYLTSQLLKLKLTDWNLYLIVGCIWTLWHIPYYLVFLPETDIQAIIPVSRLAYILISFTTYLSWTVMFTELFRVTKSVWPCIFMHMVEDSLINHLIISGYITIAAGKEILVSPINGLITSTIYIVIGLGIRAYRIRAARWPLGKSSELILN